MQHKPRKELRDWIRKTGASLIEGDGSVRQARAAAAFAAGDMAVREGLDGRVDAFVPALDGTDDILWYKFDNFSKFQEWNRQQRLMHSRR